MQTRIQVDGFKDGEVLQTYLKVLGSFTMEYDNPCEFMQGFMEWYENFKSNNTINGGVFEFAIMECLVREGVVPFYHQGTFPNIRGTRFDFVLWDGNNPVVLSAKKTLRERVKQADWEGKFLKVIYPFCSYYLVTMDEEEKVRTQRKKEAMEFDGLTECVLAHSWRFNELIDCLSKRGNWKEAKPMLPVTGRVIY